jgi:hypothetical protein
MIVQELVKGIEQAESNSNNVVGITVLPEWRLRKGLANSFAICETPARMDEIEVTKSGVKSAVDSQGTVLAGRKVQGPRE